MRNGPGLATTGCPGPFAVAVTHYALRITHYVFAVLLHRDRRAERDVAPQDPQPARAASARLDDLLNLVPARLTALLILAARHRLGLTALQAGWRRTAANAPLHRSPNAGWPEAAMAHALGLRLAGPRVYGGRQVEDAWMGDGRAAVSPDDIERAIGLAWQAWWALLLLVVLLAIAS